VPSTNSRKCSADKATKRLKRTKERNIVATKTAENLSLEIKRLIKAPRERVFDTWTSPDEILEWFGPEGTCQPLSAQVDLRVGGEYRIRAISQACGGPTEVSGVYREVQRPSRLVYTWQWSDPPLNFGETLVTVDFVDLNGATEVRLPSGRVSECGNARWSQLRVECQFGQTGAHVSWCNS
jgi:uncharacterized protein YndB with AHSA1/START domain